MLKTLDLPTKFLSKNMPKLVYMEHEKWNNRQNDASLPIDQIKNELIISNSELVNKFALQHQGLNATSAVLCLAAVGIDLILPNISFDNVEEEEIEKIKLVLQEERISYLNAITEMADSSYGRISSGEFQDVLAWARNEVTFKLIPKARAIEDNISKIDPVLFKQAGVSIFKEGLPAIGAGYLSGGLLGASKVMCEKTLKLLSHTLGGKLEQKMAPEVTYAIKIANKMKTNC